MRRLLYALFATLFCVLAIPVLLLRPKTRPGLLARLGFVRLGALKAGPRVWVHAASAGDVKNAWPVVRALKEARPDVVIILSVVTNSGAEMAPQMSPAPDAVTFLPLDAPPFVRIALGRIRPDVMLMECTELWPILLHAAKARGVNLALINGRMSEKSAKKYSSLFPWSGNPVRLFDALCMQTEDDLKRYTALGADDVKCAVTGNCKFDAAARRPPGEKVETLKNALGGREKLLVAGSTHIGEEDVVLDAFVHVRERSAGTALLWAPRYLEHVADLVGRCKARNLAVARRSEGPEACSKADVIILDTMGELAAAYALGSAAVVGGSFVDRGGQNILEPAAQAVPVLHGPDMHLAMDQASALEGRGARTVTREMLPHALVQLLEDPELARTQGREGQRVVQSLAGAAQRHLERILPLISAGSRH